MQVSCDYFVAVNRPKSVPAIRPRNSLCIQYNTELNTEHTVCIQYNCNNTTEFQHNRICGLSDNTGILWRLESLSSIEDSREI